MNKYKKFLIDKLKIKSTETPVVYFEDRDDITDEIEKSLLEIKELYDFPTEEIDNAIDSRRKSRRS